ncbi:MAG: hypothetical protein RLZZ598_555 [Pseudomonadota bacterium]
MAGLSPAAHAWPLDSLRERLAALQPGLRVDVVAECDSSNTRLLARARAGELAPCLLVAERQTAGRGRLGRRWWSETGGDAPGSLCFSLGLTLAPQRWEGLSLAVGVALADALHPSLRLKWPNDLWLCADGIDRKLGGVLIETQSLNTGIARQVVVGVGLNLRTPPAGVVGGSGAAIAPVGLEDLDPALDAPTVLDRVAPPLLAALQRFEREGFDDALRHRYLARDALLGRELLALAADGRPLHRGRGAGVDERGALLIDPGASAPLLSLLSADISVRPLSL